MNELIDDLEKLIDELIASLEELVAETSYGLLGENVTKNRLSRRALAQAMSIKKQIEEN